MRNISKSLLFLAFVAFLVSVTYIATPVTISDTYWGSDNHGYCDVIGNMKYFQIYNANINLSSTMLSTVINANLAGNGDDKLFSSYTLGPFTQVSDEKGIGYGDFFLSSPRDPNGSEPFKYDRNNNGTICAYGLALDNRWPLSGGKITIYSLNGSTNDSNALLSQFFITGANFKNGKEVAVDTNSKTVANTGITLLSRDELTIQWGRTSAKDIIEDSSPIPEPSQMLLFGTGLIALAGVGGKRFLKK
jgi:hypothetical protein